VSNTAVGICYGPSDSLPLRADADLSVRDLDTELTCGPEGRRRMYRVFVPAVDGVWAPAVHSNCQHNELAALRLRTMGPTPEEVPMSLELLARLKGLRGLARSANLTAWTLERTAASYKGRLGRRYKEALVSLEDEGLGSNDAVLTAFLKGEKFNPSLKISKPRLICPRSPRYNLVLASYLKPFEHMLWRRWRYARNCPRTRVSAKGLNGRSRARLIAEKMRMVGDCVVLEVDGKAFEAHVGRDQLLAEHSVYKAAWPKDSTLNWALSKQLELSGSTSRGVDFFREGCRASGDFNTGLGNTMLMGLFVITAVENLLQGTSAKASVLADGDNCLLFVERSYEALFRERFADTVSGLCSHELTVEKPVSILERVVFGQSRPCMTGAGLVMVRDIYKTLSGAFCGYRHYGDRSFGPRLVRAVAQAELSLCRGVPVLQPFFEAVVKCTSKYKALKDPTFFLEGHLLHVVDRGHVPIVAEARQSFSRGWDIGAEDQVHLEQRLVNLVEKNLCHVLDNGLWLGTVVGSDHGALGDREPGDMEHLFLEGPGGL